MSTNRVELIERWTAGESSIGGNHHAAAAGRVEGDVLIAVPIGGHRGETGCKLLVLDGGGHERWNASVAPEACTVHAIADPTLADFVGDPKHELIAATTENAVVAYDPLTGEQEFRHPFSNYGYTRLVIANVLGDRAPELIVSDIDGTLSIVRQDGSTAWTRPLSAYSWSAPAVADFDGDSETEVALGLGNGSAVAFTNHGDVEWTTTLEGPITWTASGNTNSNRTPEFIVATSSGTVVALHGPDGSIEWTRSLSAYGTVGPSVDGDDDGNVEVYAPDRMGCCSPSRVVPAKLSGRLS